jgi:hypothetical protein
MSESPNGLVGFTRKPNSPDIERGLRSREQSQRATVERQLHSRKGRVLENSDQAIVIEDFYCDLNARRHDFRGARGMKIDGVTHLFPRLNAASSGFASELVSIDDKAAAVLFRKFSKIDSIAFFDENFIALVDARRPSTIQIEGLGLRR